MGIAKVIAKGAKKAIARHAKAAARKGAKHVAKHAARHIGRDTLEISSKSAKKAASKAARKAIVRKAAGKATAGRAVAKKIVAGKLLGKKAAVGKAAGKAIRSQGKIAEVAFTDAYRASAEVNDRIARRSAKNVDKGLFKLIDGAKKRLDGSFYDIEDLGVAKKLIAAKKRGVKIRLVTDSDSLIEKGFKIKPREAIKRLKAARIPIITDKRSAIMHNKFMVVDGRTVWTGSANMTPTSLYNHNNNALTVKSKELAGQFSDEFNRLFEKQAFGVRARGVIAPNAPVQLRNGKVQAFFSPNGGARDAVLAELEGARRDIKFMTFSLTDKDIGALMKAKARKGVKVEGVFDRWLAAGDASLEAPFRRARIRVAKDGNEALLHHKVMIIDRKTIITGSFNFSKNAEKANNEAMLIIRNAPSAARQFLAEFGRVLGAATRFAR